jgi:YMGG-like Gly-zipper
MNTPNGPAGPVVYPTEAREEVDDAMMTRIVTPIIGLSLAGVLLAACGTLGGAAIGAGSGAAIGAGVDSKNRGRGAATGALIGTGVGAAAGTIYDWSRRY